ncbi:MAG TPA: pantoate--beta-alanine ligase [Candidatus Aquicultor sp.]|jgi:pantoate--beta-alanine ligase
MLTITTVREVCEAINAERARGKTIGLVPTMGYLHEGHLTLMREAKRQADIVVASIFVNPTQFGPTEDLDAYPRDLARDGTLAQDAGVDVLFVPAVREMYPTGYSTYVDVEDITVVLCGQSRPGHFRGVATVVTKLLNIVAPDIAFFGEKDWQQLAVIKRMVADLNMSTEIVGVPIVREPDGLAMSSRNTYLSPGERRAALALSKSLELARVLVADGVRDTEIIVDKMRAMLANESLTNIEYVEIVDPDRLSSIEILSGPALVALAVRVGTTRLIDNALIGQDLEKTGDFV